VSFHRGIYDLLTAGDGREFVDDNGFDRPFLRRRSGWGSHHRFRAASAPSSNCGSRENHLLTTGAIQRPQEDEASFLCFIVCLTIRVLGVDGRRMRIVKPCFGGRRLLLAAAPLDLSLVGVDRARSRPKLVAATPSCAPSPRFRKADRWWLFDYAVSPHWLISPPPSKLRVDLAATSALPLGFLECASQPPRTVGLNPSGSLAAAAQS